MIVNEVRKCKSGICYAPKTVMIQSLQTLAAVSFPQRVVPKAKNKQDRKKPALFNEKFRCMDIFCLCSKTCCCYDSLSNKFNFSSKRLNRRTFEDSADGPMAKYRKVLVETESLTSTNRGFRTKNPLVAIYEQTKNGISYIYLNQRNESDGFHIIPLKHYILNVRCVCGYLYSLTCFVKSFSQSFYIQ